MVKLVNKPQAPKENGEADDDEDWQVSSGALSLLDVLKHYNFTGDCQ